MLNQKIVKICEQKLTYLNYLDRTKKIYTHVSKKLLNKVVLPI